ncbi:MAG TPA: replicative DNA helicase [Chlamydiales bacterium]|nr:replicative DNA helicase [Chlamydiales bacterium]
MNQAKTPPNSKESEMMVLGCMLTSINGLKVAADALIDENFFYAEHQIVFSTLRAAYRSDKPADIHLIGEELKRKNKLDAIGGIGYLTALAQYAGTSAYIEEYVKQVQELSQARQTVDLSQRIIQNALERPQDIPVILSRTIEDFKRIAEASSGSHEGTFIGEILSGKKSKISSTPLMDRIEERKAHVDETGEPYINGLPTGFEDLDNLATILIDTNLVIIGARPAMGKTALALSITSNVSQMQGRSVAIISLEMGADQITERFLSLRTSISGENIQRGILSNVDISKLREADQQLRKEKILLYDEQCHTIEQAVSLSRKAKGKHDIRLLVIDYLQLLGSQKSSDGRQYEVADISRKLKLLAQELSIPIICLSQLSRKVEERQDHRPLLSDLRDSGQVEQDADVVLFLYRRNYYDKYDSPHKADLILAKNRHGPIGDVLLHFDKECGVFSDMGLEQFRKDFKL